MGRLAALELCFDTEGEECAICILLSVHNDSWVICYRIWRLVKQLHLVVPYKVVLAIHNEVLELHTLATSCKRHTEFCLFYVFCVELQRLWDGKNFYQLACLEEGANRILVFLYNCLF